MNVETIVALDFDNIDDAKKLVTNIGDAINYYKVGLELYVSAGEAVIDFLKNHEKKVFLDLKFHDIPNTASKVVAKAAVYGVDMMNVHAQGGAEMMSACVKILSETCSKKGVNKPLLIAVTLLTSLDENHLEIFGINGSAEDYVLRLAALAKQCGLDGVVSSAKETAIIKSELGSDFITVTPGIRFADADNKDQKRVVTPLEAKKSGTDFIVVGRPITASPDPRKASLNILKELH